MAQAGDMLRLNANGSRHERYAAPIVLAIEVCIAESQTKQAGSGAAMSEVKSYGHLATVRL